jgi:hypothetical protein
MTRQNGPYFDENYLRQGSPTTVATLPYVVAS